VISAANNGELFFEIQFVTQFTYSKLSLLQNIQRSRRKKPCCEQAFSHESPACAEQLVQTVVPENIEIFSVEVIPIIELISFLSAA
jgi:hypothetical protein